ncbi:MAG: phage minor head protein [Gemmatimonadaceae bacterium]|nr:phage minor head protein [Gemmatimonadaceae bacterium]
MLKELAERYGETWAAIKSELDRVGADIQAAQARGETISRGWLVKARRLESLEAQTLAEMRLYADFTERRITVEQTDALTAGRQDALALLEETLGPIPPGAEVFRPALPIEQLAEMVGRSSSGRPLGELLAGLGQDAAEKVRRELLMGVALGRNPREIARHARSALGGNLARSMTIARTEVLSAYRASSHNVYRANPGVMAGWLWHAQLSQRTCPVCIAQHGTFHTLDETLDTHPACRCAMLPQTRSWAELGFPDVPETGVTLEPGEEWFARQEPGLQRAILGPGKQAAYERGDITLADLVGKTKSPQWGNGRRELSLRDALGVHAGERKAWSCGSRCSLASYRPATAEDLKRLKVPPAWTDVRVATDPNAKLQVIGHDAKGRAQYRYSAEHTAAASRAKFERIRKFEKDLPKFLPRIQADAKTGVEEAAALKLIHRTGLRVGSDRDTLAKVKAYGASTLRAEHVTINGSQIKLLFTGKKGTTINRVIDDKELADMLAPRVARGGRLFATDDKRIRDYLHGASGKKYTPKDFRTRVGTQEGLAAVRSMPAPKTQAEYNRARREVGKHVSVVLGNTPTVALESYVDPRVFQEWGMFK